MVDKYYRKIDNVGNDIENSIQISGILLKLKEYDEKLGDLSKIGNNENNISSNSKKKDANKNNISSNSKKITTNEDEFHLIQKKIDANKDDISSNLKKIDANKNNINYNSTDINNLLSFYKLGKIYIYDIQKGNKFVDKNNYYHVFEKEIIYNFIKDSYLEIILKVLTQISSYILIGFFEILCNFYDDNNTLFYTISLSTSYGID